MSTILSIDPGYDRIGWVVGKSEKGVLQLLNLGCVFTNSTHTLFQRYQDLSQQLDQIITQYQPTEAAIETLFFSKNQKTAMQVAEARGVILSCFFRHNLACFEYNPGQIKVGVTGYGKADKIAVEKMVRLQLGRQLEKFSQQKILDDTIDAMALFLTHVATQNFSQK